MDLPISTRSAQWNSTLGRIAGIVFGIATQLLFLWTVVKLFSFLRDQSVASSKPFGFWVDLSLVIGFAIPHSVLLAPWAHQRLKRNLPTGLLGCLHCSVTCLSLLSDRRLDSLYLRRKLLQRSAFAAFHRNRIPRIRDKSSRTSHHRLWATQKDASLNEARGRSAAPPGLCDQEQFRYFILISIVSLFVPNIHRVRQYR